MLLLATLRIVRETYVPGVLFPELSALSTNGLGLLLLRQEANLPRVDHCRWNAKLLVWAIFDGPIVFRQIDVVLQSHFENGVTLSSRITTQNQVREPYSKTGPLRKDAGSILETAGDDSLRILD